MDPIKSLISRGVKNVRLNILVFGPQVASLSAEPRTLNLQNKRIEIRQELEAAGHFVRYAEELIDPSLPDAHGNAFLQEIIIMAEYDLIFVIVDSPGSIAEATVISTRPNLATKASLYLDSSYATGLTAQACQLAEYLGAEFRLYTYPTDLTDCHLLTSITERVTKAQFIKLIS
ncbi:hypothetical protein [Dyadobacter sp. 22481]|uniref:hypothetical protein n=1 Tax=Dyadobacter sp. 22481 TaxID=3453926 RepID=UPI003F839ACE